MIKHIFCTGQPGCGKTTLVRRCVREIVSQHVQVTGFVTDEVLSTKSTRTGFDVVSLSSNGEDDRRGILSRKNKYETSSNVVWKKTGKYHVNVTEFERIALSAMRSSTEKKPCVLIVDEVGRMELHSESFRHLMKKLLNIPTVHVVGIYIIYTNKHPSSYIFTFK